MGRVLEEERKLAVRMSHELSKHTEEMARAGGEDTVQFIHKWQRQVNLNAARKPEREQTNTGHRQRASLGATKPDCSVCMVIRSFLYYYTLL